MDPRLWSEPFDSRDDVLHESGKSNSIEDLSVLGLPELTNDISVSDSDQFPLKPLPLENGDLLPMKVLVLTGLTLI